MAIYSVTNSASMQDLIQKLQAARDAIRAAEGGAAGAGRSGAAGGVGGVGGAGALGEAGAVGRAGGIGRAGAAKTADFTEILKASLNRVNGDQVAADGLSRRFQLNDPNVTLEETMVATAKANVSFQAAIQVRNKLVTAYQDIMNMQV